ncbi:MAG TPA: hypothetical protein VED87_10220 [Methylocystis sp.]|nr:hypothetical protein [Methylocystis sp.]
MDEEVSGKEERRNEVREVVGVFNDLASLQSAIDDLLTDGFDRSEISLLAEDKDVREKAGAKRAVELEDDSRTPRLHYIEAESLALGKVSLVAGLFYIGAFMGAGALTAGSGIFASPLVAGAATGGLAGLAGLVLAQFIGRRQTNWARAQLERGGLLLWARTWTEEREREAVAIMQRNGGHDVHVHTATV